MGRVARASAWVLPVAAFADYVGTVERVPDDTMDPSLGGGTLVWVDKLFCTQEWLGNDRSLSSRIDRSLRGQVVYAKSPLVPDDYIMRRVIGIPGDWVTSSPSSSEGGGRKRVHVGQGQIWVEGDNRNPSATEDNDSKFTSGLVSSSPCILVLVFPVTDSRLLFQIPFGLVQGQVTRVVWPPSRMDRVRDKIDLTRSFPVGHGHRDDA